MSAHAWPAQAVASLEVVIEVPRFSFIKRGSRGRIDFVSPVPCPFNYGSVPTLIGLEGDLLDAVVLGPRLALGARLEVPVWGAIGVSDRGLYDDKLICSRSRPSASQRARVLRFFELYAGAKRLLNVVRRRPGLTRCEGFRDARRAIAACVPRDASWSGPAVAF